MKKENDVLKVSFTIPDKITVRMQLAYHSATIGALGSEMIERFWDGAKTIIQDWQCEDLPDFRVDLETVEDPRMTSIIMWAGMEVWNHMRKLETLPKNS